jgi:hypothetical protein
MDVICRIESYSRERNGRRAGIVRTRDRRDGLLVLLAAGATGVGPPLVGATMVRLETAGHAFRRRGLPAGAINRGRQGIGDDEDRDEGGGRSLH